MPGPTAKSPELKLIEGNLGKRPINRGPQFADKQFGTPPKHLGKDAKKLWKELARILEDAGLGGRAFRDVLELTCDAHQIYRDASAKIAELGPTFTTETGYVAARPEIKMRDSAMRLKKSLLNEMGLSQTARGKVVVPPSPRRSLREQLMDDFPAPASSPATGRASLPASKRSLRAKLSDD